MFLRGRRRACRLLVLRPDSCVLEVGCGTGLNFRHILKELDPRRGRLVGLDFSPDMLRRAAERVAARGWRNVSLVRGDASALCFQQRFDAVLFAYSLAMISDWEAAMRNAWEHLREGGRLVVLEFGDFAGWGPLSGAIHRWMKWHSVEARRPYADAMRGLFPEVHIEARWGGYWFIATGCKKSTAGLLPGRTM